MCMPPFKTSAPAQTHDRFLHKRGPDAAGLESEPFSLPPPNTPPPRPLPTLSNGEFLNIGDDEDIEDGGVDLGNPSPRSVLKTKTTSDDDGSSNASSSRNLNIIPAPLQEAVAAPPSPIPTMASMQTWLESIPIAIPPSQASDPDPSSDSSSGDSSSSSEDDDDDDDEEEDSYMEKEIVAWRPEPLPAGREGGGKGKRAGFAASLHHLQVQTLEGSRGECIFSAGSPLSPFHYQNHLRPLSGLLEACFFCNSSFSPGKDIYMYRGDRAFCSMECRYEQIIIDERNEICPKSSKN